MLELNNFKSAEDLLKHQKKLFTAFKDMSIYEETKDRIWNELSEICKLLGDSMTTNRVLLEILLEIINNRQEEYQLKIISAIKNYEKIYTFNDFEHIEIEKRNNPIYWNAVVIVKKGIDIMEIIKEKNNAIFFRPDIYKDIYKNKSFIIYDAFIGNINIDQYLNNEVCISKMLDLNETQGLTKEEIKQLNIKVLELYKQSYEQIKNKTRKK